MGLMDWIAIAKGRPKGNLSYSLIELLSWASWLIAFYAVFRTAQSVRPGGRIGRTAGGSPSVFESMDRL